LKTPNPLIAVGLINGSGQPHRSPHTMPTSTAQERDWPYSLVQAGGADPCHLMLLQILSLREGSKIRRSSE